MCHARRVRVVSGAPWLYWTNDATRIRHRRFVRSGCLLSRRSDSEKAPVSELRQAKRIDRGWYFLVDPDGQHHCQGSGKAAARVVAVHAANKKIGVPN